MKKKKVIWKEQETETTENPVIYSEERYMENIEIEAEDVNAAVESIKIGKAGETDGMIGEIIKYGGEALKQTLLKLVKEI